MFTRNIQYYKFCAYGFLKNLKIYDVFFLLFLRDSGLSFLQIGTLYSIRQVTIYILEIPSGLAADSIGRKTILIIGMLSCTISFIVFAVGNSFSHFALAMLFFGTGEAFRSGTHKAMIMAYLEKTNYLKYKTHYYGSTRGWSQFGSAISSLLAMAVLLIDYDYQILFYATAVPYILNVLVLWSYPAYLNQSSVKSEAHAQKAGSVFKATLMDFLKMLKDANTMRAIFSAASFIGIYKSLKDYLQPILKTVALSLPVLIMIESEKRTAIVVGTVYFLIFLMTSWTSRNAWRIENKFKQLPFAINFAYLSGIICILLSGILVWFDMPIFAVIIFIGLYLLQNIRRPLTVSYLSDKIDKKVLASGLSVESQMETILVALSAPFLGYLVDSIGLGPGLAVMALLFLLLYPVVKLRLN